MGRINSAGEQIFGIAEDLIPRLRPSDSNTENHIYTSAVVLPGGRYRKHAFVKIFPPQHRQQLVYNEVIAHYLALQCGLRSPFTFPCICHTSLFGQKTLQEIVTHQNSEFVLGVASLAVSPRAIQPQFSHSEAVWADLMKWTSVADVAVFDELVGNDDRHISNLIRTGPHEYSLIDNERILFGEKWFSRELRKLIKRHCDPNVIADSISETTDELMQHRMMAIAKRHVTRTHLNVPKISTDLELLCRAPVGTTQRLITMLNQRRLLLQFHMHWHLQKSDLFRASLN